MPVYFTEFAGISILETNGSLLDIGCGGLTQTSSLYLQTPKECTLLDRSIRMLQIAEKRLRGANNLIPDNIKLIHADAFNLPFEKSSFDILSSFGTIHLFDDKKNYIRTILQFLKSGGNFYFSIMTNKYLSSRLFMNFLRLFGEFGIVCSEREYLALFSPDEYSIESYMKGSVLFIKGQKL